ncbi:MAG: Permuted papain-like amidase enzyme YaeF/YiiX, family [Labilithrix sp.]|nr:Permuted papain-like amidase enzyme YaeF/YiiX, family [Labilithrix sp.]
MKLARALTLLLALGAAACGTMSLPPVSVLGTKTDETHKATYNGLALRSGQLIITESPDATSYVFVLIPKKFYPFTHVAVISVEDGEPWVYDVTGEVKTFPFRKRLMDNVTGKMYRRRLFEYAAPNLYAEIYDPPAGADPEKVAAFVRQKYKEGVEFDAFFNYHDHSKLFCSELVSMAIEAAGGPAIRPEESNPNPSVVEGMKWLGVPPGEALAAGRFADPSRYIGALGQFPNRTAAWTYFEAKRELHRRFTMDQRLGFMLTIDGNGQINVRPEISAFTTNAWRLFANDPNPPEPFDPRIEAAVRKLAADSFGPFPDPAPAPVAAQ